MVSLRYTNYESISVKLNDLGENWLCNYNKLGLLPILWGYSEHAKKCITSPWGARDNLRTYLQTWYSMNCSITTQLCPIKISGLCIHVKCKLKSKTKQNKGSIGETLICVTRGCLKNNIHQLMFNKLESMTVFRCSFCTSEAANGRLLWSCLCLINSCALVFAANRCSGRRIGTLREGLLDKYSVFHPTEVQQSHVHRQLWVWSSLVQTLDTQIL